LASWGEKGLERFASILDQWQLILAALSIGYRASLFLSDQNALSFVRENTNICCARKEVKRGA
jgi:hypothetical protein